MLGLILAMTAAVPLTGCNKNEWEDETNMGEVVVNEEDTESLEVSTETPEAAEEEDSEEDLMSKLTIVSHDVCTVVTDRCYYSSSQRTVIFKGRLSVSQDYDGKIFMKITNAYGDVIGEREMDFSIISGANLGFAIEAPVNDESVFEDIQGVEISFS